MYSIYKKEINSFFSSLIGHVVIGLFLTLLGLFLWVFEDTNILTNKFATLDQFFDLAPFVFIFLIPAITMRMIAEEKQTGTIELLVTRPLTDMQIILGKFFAAVVLVAFALLPTILYYITVYQLGSPKGNLDSGAILGSYIGLLLLGAVFTSIGLFASSISKNQIISFLFATFLCFFLYLGFEYISKMPIFIGKIDDIIQMLGINYHYKSISNGVVVIADIVYFISVILLFLKMTQVSLESRKW
jgi:ABC-2 type transport system permease protein